MFLTSVSPVIDPPNREQSLVGVDLISESFNRDVDRFSSIWQNVEAANVLHDKISAFRGDTDYFPLLRDKMAAGTPLALVAGRFLPDSTVLELIPHPQLENYLSTREIGAQIHQIVTSSKIAGLDRSYLDSPRKMAYKACAELRLAEDRIKQFYKAFKGSEIIPPTVICFSKPPPFLASSAAALHAPVVIEPGDKVGNKSLRAINIILHNSIIRDQGAVDQLMAFLAQPLADITIAPIKRKIPPPATTAEIKSLPKPRGFNPTNNRSVKDLTDRAKKVTLGKTVGDTNSRRGTSDTPISIKELEAKLKERGIIV
ncbi:MAG: hypothetical protein RBS77_06450 [Candidatus Moranbacteria bacterium]|jgi:hypothetical protein|nr:hypothetical protein [Candidatus Moranbacteria bacterium]